MMAPHVRTSLSHWTKSITIAINQSRLHCLRTQQSRKESKQHSSVPPPAELKGGPHDALLGSNSPWVILVHSYFPSQLLYAFHSQYDSFYLYFLSNLFHAFNSRAGHSYAAAASPKAPSLRGSPPYPP